jgi:hypothetical protein
MNLSLAEKLMHTTVRLECLLNDGRLSTGTGFFFSFKLDATQTIPLIFTNRHVIENVQTGTFVLTKCRKDGAPIIGSHERISINDFESHWIKHPDPSVDLAAFPIAELLNNTTLAGNKIFFMPIDDSLIPEQDVVNNLSGIEDITMIGYPNGIWDQKNNLPIVRRGITATNPKHDYNGLPIFVIDCACFPGSSGSPVLIVNQGSYADSQGNLNIANRVIFLGVLYAGPQHIAEGEIKTIDIPLQQISISLSHIPNNLGFVVKSQKIKDFKKLLLPFSHEL